MEFENNIDIDFSMVNDKYHISFWKDFWNKDENVPQGASSIDPDLESKKLQYFHKTIWGNRKLPNDEIMKLEYGCGCDLYWKEKGITFSSDWFANTFLHWKSCSEVFRKIREEYSNIEDYRKLMEDYTTLTYTFGGSIIFPKRSWGINQTRGLLPVIADRADLTLECIKRYYDFIKNEKNTSSTSLDNPLKDTFEKDRAFFELFGDFDGYVNYFYLQDLLNKDKSVKIAFRKDGFGDIDFNSIDSAYPKNADEWKAWYKYTNDFIKARNERIKKAFVN